MPRGMTRADVMTWSGRTLVDRDGQQIGQIDDIFYDSRSGEPEWGHVSRGLLRKRESLVPLAEMETVDDKTMRVPFAEDEVMSAPPVQVHGSLTHDEKEALYRHYRMGGAEGGQGER
ncbi:MAG: hypothetical protein IBX62_06650 [Coriobacteriia bacterium]|nr:hypothetical protein [Coriobacteriia bacterium]